MDQKGNDKGSFEIIQISSGVFCKTDSKLLKTGTCSLATVVLSCPFTCLIQVFASASNNQ